MKKFKYIKDYENKQINSDNKITHKLLNYPSRAEAGMLRRYLLWHWKLHK